MYTTENFRARKQAEKEAPSTGQSVTINTMVNTPPLATGQPQVHPTSTQSLTTMPLHTGLPDTLVPLLPIGQRLHNLAMGTDASIVSTMSHGIPPMQIPPSYTMLLVTDGN